MTSMTVSTSAQFWDRIARKYAAKPISNLPAYEKTLERTRSYLSPTDSVLEVGCGTASTALLLAPSVARYTASDYSSGMVEVGREKATAAQANNLSVVQGVLGDASLGDGPYNAVLAFNLLHLVPDPAGDARRAYDLLAPGGYFISKSACLTGWFTLLRPVFSLMRLLGKAPSITYLTVDGLEAMFRDAGFEIVESYSPSGSDTGRFIVARKP